jgi:casein kinase II subunit beta
MGDNSMTSASKKDTELQKVEKEESSSSSTSSAQRVVTQPIQIDPHRQRGSSRSSRMKQDNGDDDDVDVVDADVDLDVNVEGGVPRQHNPLDPHDTRRDGGGDFRGRTTRQNTMRPDEDNVGEENVSRDNDEDEEEDEDEEDVSSDSAATWISWFCSLRGNEFFIEVDERWIQDEFNLHGLQQLVPNYQQCLDVILDRAPTFRQRAAVGSAVFDDGSGSTTAMDSRTSAATLSEEQLEAIDAGAELLYGLIHARYILTARGLELMLEKYNNQEFGRCPRVYCEGQSVLPVGTSDLPRQATVKLYCPRCQDIFYPKFSKHSEIDGAYFGTTFPHLFLQVYPELIPPPPKYTYVPRVFGFKIHPSSRQVLKAQLAKK